MNSPGHDGAQLTWQQMLAAFVDGELDDGARRQVERRLRDDPRAVSELESQRRLSPANEAFWSSVQPPQPSEQKWDHVRNAVVSAFEPRAQPGPTFRTRTRARWLRRGLLGALLALPSSAVAATILLAVLLHRPVTVDIGSIQDADAGDEVFPLTQMHDVEIVSVRHADSKQLIVGEPPLNESVTLASASDIHFDGVQPDRDGTMPDVQVGVGGVPMVYTPAPRPK